MRTIHKRPLILAYLTAHPQTVTLSNNQLRRRVQQQTGVSMSLSAVRQAKRVWSGS
jgi:hypothetical protein